MKERLLEFLKAENKSSAQLAEEIGVQPSGISHILSGRNNPSLDFVLKMLEKYQYLSTDWLLFGKGTMYKEIKLQTLFDDTDIIDSKKYLNQSENESVKSEKGSQIVLNVEQSKEFEVSGLRNGSSVLKIVWFYTNNSFEEYFPKH
jgi:transcriptional regulator with XRE-family HTH domain